MLFNKENVEEGKSPLGLMFKANSEDFSKQCKVSNTLRGMYIKCKNKLEITLYRDLFYIFELHRLLQMYFLIK